MSFYYKIFRNLHKEFSHFSFSTQLGYVEKQFAIGMLHNNHVTQQSINLKKHVTPLFNSHI